MNGTFLDLKKLLLVITNGQYMNIDKNEISIINEVVRI